MGTPNQVNQGGKPANGATAMSIAAPDPSVLVQIEQVKRQFGDFVAVDGINLEIYRGEFLSLLGPSGCGKTTLLRMLAGFETPDQGRILIDGADMANIPPFSRPTNLMFQSYALFPHMTVEGNIAFGLKQDKVKSSEIKQRVGEMLDMVQLGKFATRKPDQLSGGQRQRVALARALIKRPKLLLLDEPLSALDRKLREQTQFELVNIQKKLGISFVLVTHDQDEAMSMSDRIAVMNAGRIVQLGLPRDIYEFPNSRYVAEFIGSVTVFNGVMTKDERDYCVITCDEFGVEFHINHGVSGNIGMDLSVALRPEKITLKHLDDAEKEAQINKKGGNISAENNYINHLVGKIKGSAYQGDVSYFHVETITGKKILVTTPNISRYDDLSLVTDDWVEVSWKSDAVVVLPQ